MKQFFFNKFYLSQVIYFFAVNIFYIFFACVCKIVIPLQTEIHDKDLTMGI